MSMTTPVDTGVSGGEGAAGRPQESSPPLRRLGAPPLAASYATRPRPRCYSALRGPRRQEI
ncbi:hypothetical protein [Pyrobaculum sp.]|uniref:hypothetical protein n=1 Tax=Pyrobaculum sp. TaxID=2004705 RepID=UPI003D0DAC6A